MATKENKSKPNKNKDESRVMAILKKEYAFENWLLAILSPVFILYGVYIITDQFGANVIGLGTSGIGFIDWFFNTDLKRIIVGVFMILVGALVLVYLAIPFVKPSLAEMKKVNWPTSHELFKNVGRVFAFLVVLMLFFVLLDVVLNPLFDLIYG